MSTSTATLPPASTRSLPGRRYDRVFFPVMSLLALGTVFLGFAKSYFLAGMIHAPLPSRIVHVHGAVFTIWIALLIVQTGIVSGRRLDLHRKLGLFGFAWAALMVFMGLLAARNSLMRGFSPAPGLPAAVFFIVPVTDIFVFATLVYLGWALRNRGLDHKRLMMMATLGILDAAVARWPFTYIRNPHLADLTLYALLLMMVGYDLWSTHKVQKVTWMSALLIVVVGQARIPLGMTHAWMKFAEIVAKG